MADILWADVQNITSDASLATVHIDAQTAILGYVNEHVGGESFSTWDLKLARVWLAAHMGLFAIPGSGDAGGVATSESGGDGLAVSYSTSAVASLDALGETDYGRAYLSMVRTSCAGPVLL